MVASVPNSRVGTFTPGVKKLKCMLLFQISSKMTYVLTIRCNYFLVSPCHTAQLNIKRMPHLPRSAMALVDWYEVFAYLISIDSSPFIHQPVPFHHKWRYLATQRDPDGKTIVDKLGLPCLLLNDNPNGGQRFNFLGGEIVRYLPIPLNAIPLLSSGFYVALTTTPRPVLFMDQFTRCGMVLVTSTLGGVARSQTNKIAMMVVAAVSLREDIYTDMAMSLSPSPQSNVLQSTSPSRDSLLGIRWCVTVVSHLSLHTDSSACSLLTSNVNGLNLLRSCTRSRASQLCNVSRSHACARPCC